MKRLRDKSTYKFEEIPAGARVVITTADPQALVAVRQFLRNTKPATPRQFKSASRRKRHSAENRSVWEILEIDLRWSAVFQTAPSRTVVMHQI